MKLLHFFLFSVFVVVAFGKKLECLNKEITICTQKMDTKNTDICARMNEGMNCLEAASKKCKDDAPDAVKNLVAIGRDICTTDSQASKDFAKYIPCLQNPKFLAGFVTGCLADYMEEFKGLGEPDMANIQAYSEKVVNFICPKREKLVNCAFGQIKSQCGEAEEKFFHKMGDPLNALVKEQCGDSASIPSISMALIFLHLIIAIFSTRKIF